MMTKLNKQMNTALADFEAKRAAFDEYRNANSKVFAHANVLEIEMQKSESTLREAARLAQHGAETETTIVKFVPRKTVLYDFNKMAEVASQTELRLIQKQAATITVDKTKLQKLVETGGVSVDVERAGYVEKELTPAIMIKVKDQDNDQENNETA